MHHRYVIEPQSRQYLAHGDLWDHLYLRSRERPERVFLPLTLEMGSWIWVKKNPRQLFSRQGIFNPLVQHRAAPRPAPAYRLVRVPDPRGREPCAMAPARRSSRRRIRRGVATLVRGLGAMSTWVLLRGLAREARHWGEFPHALAAQTGAERLVCLDLPGNGMRNDERSPAQVPAIVASCREALHVRHAAPPYFLVAMSLGAMVAVAWATRHPQEIEGAVLVNTSLRGFGAWYQRLRVRQYPRLLSALAGRGVAAERTVLAITSRHPSVAPETLIAHWTAIRRQRPVARINALHQLWAAARYPAPAARPGVPFLVLASARDELVDHACSLRLATQWDAPLVIHPTAGHDLPLDAPEWVIAEIVRWRERAAPTGAPGDRWRATAR